MKFKNNIIAAAFLIFATCMYGGTKVDIKEVFEKNNFGCVAGMKAIEAPVLKCFSKYVRDSKLADTAEPFDSGCNRSGALPTKRLIVAGKSATTWFIAYEQGGVGLVRNLVLIQADGKKPKVVWAGELISGKQISNYDDVRQLILSGKVQQRGP